MESEVKNEGTELAQTTTQTRSRREMESTFVSRPSTLVSKKG